MMKSLITIILLLTLLSACSAESSPSTQILPTHPIPTPTSTEIELLAKSFELLNRDALLIQLDYQPTTSTTHNQYDFGRVPVFTLLADGRLFYLDKTGPGKLPVLAYLTPLETAKILTQVYQNGFLELKSFTDHCSVDAESNQVCKTDAEYSILSVRAKDGSLRQIRNYAGFANDPGILAAIIDTLRNYSNPSAEQFIPDQGALFLRPIQGEIEHQPLDYPLNSPYSPPPLEIGETWAIELQSRQVRTYLDAIEGQLRPSYFMINNQVLQAEFVPWLPGNTFSAEMAEAFPPTLIETSEQHWLSICPSDNNPTQNQGRFRLVFINDGNLLAVDEGTDVLQIESSGNVKDFIFSSDFAIAYYILREERGIELWGADLFLGESFPIDQNFENAVDLEFHGVSDDNNWLAVTVMEDEKNGSLWAVRTNGEGKKLLADSENLKTLHPEFNSHGVKPHLVQWIPGTHLLVYDSLPAGSDKFAHVPRNAVINVDTGNRQDYPAGYLDFSPDGKAVVARQTDHLILANADGGEPHPLETTYYALEKNGYYLYPPVQWSPDSQILLVITSESVEIPYQEFNEALMILSSIQVENERVFPLASLEGSPESFELSPGNGFVSYWSASFQSNKRTLWISLVDGAEKALYDQKELINFLGWSPDGQFFLYSYGEDPAYQRVMLGNPCAPVTPLFEGPYPEARWLDGERFILETTGNGSANSQLFLGNILGEFTPLATINWTDVPRWEAVVLP